MQGCTHTQAAGKPYTRGQGAAAPPRPHPAPVMVLARAACDSLYPPFSRHFSRRILFFAASSKNPRRSPKPLGVGVRLGDSLPPGVRG